MEVGVDNENSSLNNNIDMNMEPTEGLSVLNELLETVKTLKKTCVCCAKAKIVCSSTLPKCSRCNSKDLPCIYEPEKKRGRKKLRTKGRNKSNDASKGVILAKTSPNEQDKLGQSDNINIKADIKQINKCIINGKPIVATKMGNDQSVDAMNQPKECTSLDILNIMSDHNMPLLVGSRGYAKRLRKDNRSSDNDEKKSTHHHPTISISSTSSSTSSPIMVNKKAKVKREDDDWNALGHIQYGNTNTNIFHQHQQKCNPNSVTSSSETISISDVDMLKDIEKIIFSTYFELVEHISLNQPSCILSPHLSMVKEKMTAFVVQNSHINVFTHMFQQRLTSSEAINNNNNNINTNSGNNISNIINSNCNHGNCNSCQDCRSFTSIDIENDKFDFFSCLLSDDPASALVNYSRPCATHLIRTNNTSNQHPFIFLDNVDRPLKSSSTTINGNSISVGPGKLLPTVNSEFINSFGYTSEDISNMFVQFDGGLLPFCGDLFAMLLKDSNQTQRVIHRYAKKMSQSISQYNAMASKAIGSCFTIETLFSIGCDEFPLIVRNKYGTSNIPCKCQILSRTIYLSDRSYGGSQLHINFVPIEPEDHSQLKIMDSIAYDESWIDKLINNMKPDKADASSYSTASDVSNIFCNDTLSL